MESSVFELVNQKTGIMEQVAELLMALIAWKQLQQTFSRFTELFTSPLNTDLFVCNQASFACIHLSNLNHFPLSWNAENDSQSDLLVTHTQNTDYRRNGVKMKADSWLVLWLESRFIFVITSAMGCSTYGFKLERESEKGKSWPFKTEEMQTGFQPVDLI